MHVCYTNKYQAFYQLVKCFFYHHSATTVLRRVIPSIRRTIRHNCIECTSYYWSVSCPLVVATIAGLFTCDPWCVVEAYIYLGVINYLRYQSICQTWHAVLPATKQFNQINTNIMYLYTHAQDSRINYACEVTSRPVLAYQLSDIVI